MVEETQVNNQVAAAVIEAPAVAVVEAAPVVQTVVETAPVATVEVVAPQSETVLGEALAAPEPVKVTEEIKTIEEVKPPVVSEENKVLEGQSEDPAPPTPPTYEPFTMPEGITLDAERVGKFTEILSELELGAKGIDHTLVQQFGQKAVDFHVQEVQRAVEDVTKVYQTAWEQQKTDWKDSFLADPEIGGNRFQTTVDSARNFIRTHGGTPEQQTEFRSVMETSGLGNHPAIIRLLANAGRAMEEGRPLAATKPVSQSKSKTATLYGGKSNL